MKFKVYKDRNKEWRWTLFASNGRKVADCGEGYQRKSKCLRMINRILPDAKIEFVSVIH